VAAGTLTMAAAMASPVSGRIRQRRTELFTVVS
jgi:hypothetical protein